MIAPTKTKLLVNRQVLSKDEAEAERDVLASLRQRMSTFVGTRREVYDMMTAETPIELGVTLEAVNQGDVCGWWVRPDGAPAGRAILFLHGGAYMLGSAQAYRGFASQIAVRAGVAVFVLDYPLAPEQPFPAAYYAAVAARRWLGSQGFAQIVLAGDSAGGGLALATLGEPVLGSPNVAAVVVFSPWTDLALSGPSFNSPDTHDPVFQPAGVAAAATAYLGAADPKDARASPLYGVPEALPPILMQVGTDELLLDDATRYAALAGKRGGEVRLDIFEGLHHVFQRRTVELSSARKAFDDAARFLAGHWSEGP